MARKLVNELTWSVSRDRLFQECRRAYYYHYYGSWEGWDSGAPERTRLIYRLKNIMTLDMWAGGIVHEVIAEALKRYAIKQGAIATGELQAHARQKLRSGWKEAVAQAWLARPKSTNLHELYYGNGKTLPAELTERIKERVNGCLAAFAESALLDEILATSYLSWKPVDQLDSFTIDGALKVWAAIDFAFVMPSGHLRVLDWKTGAEREDELRLQLACYALYAEQAWHTPVENQRPAGVFLRDEARVSDYALSAEHIVDAKDRILSSSVEMRSPLADPEKNAAREEDFPTCDREWTCARCKFREICPAVATPSGPDDA